MSRKFKVLQLQNNYNVSASDLAEQIIQGLPADRYEVTTAFLRGKPGPGQPISKASKSIYFDFEKGKTKGLRLHVLMQLYRHCKSEGYDVIIAHRFKPINAMMKLNRSLKVPACIGVLHGLGEYDRLYRRWELRRLINSSWKLVGVSRAVCNDLLNCGAGLTHGDVVQINNAIDVQAAEEIQLSRNAARQALGIPQDVFVFGTIGRLVPVKGHIYLIEAFAKIKNKYPSAVLVIIGEGRSRSDLESAISRLGLVSRVLLLGEKDNALQYVRAFDVFVMPSLSEGLPLALLEAMSGHLPVIGSDIDSLRPILEDCGGYIFSAGDVLGLTRQLDFVQTLTSKKLRTVGDQTYNYLCSSHKIEMFRDSYLTVIEQLLKNNKRRRSL
jgi:glycosyltransferase involved in cell wall biosynthesis